MACEYPQNPPQEGIDHGTGEKCQSGGFLQTRLGSSCGRRRSISTSLVNVDNLISRGFLELVREGVGSTRKGRGEQDKRHNRNTLKLERTWFQQ